MRSQVDGILRLNTPDAQQFEITNTGPGGTTWRIASTQDGWNAGGGKFLINNSTNTASSKFVITPTGNIGISTVNPEARLHIAGSSTSARLLFDNAGDIMWKTSSGSIANVFSVHSDDHTYMSGPKDIIFRTTTSFSERMRIDEGGYVGIGTNNPLDPLHVVADEFRDHVVTIENTSSNSSADGLEIKINRDKAGPGNNFITFRNSNSTAGRIEGFRVGEGPNFTNFPGINLADYFDLVDWEDIVFDPGSFGNICQTQSAILPSSFDAGGVTSFSNLASCVFTGTNCNSWFETPSFVPPVNQWRVGTYDICNESPPEIDFSALLNPEIRTTAFSDIQAITEWAIENGIEVFTALDPWVNQYLQDPDYWSNVALAKDGGITYGSKGADYAEWLEKENPNQAIDNGQIVGVKNGKISLDTKDADQVMAISVMPVVIGNMPDTTRQADFEKVAFIGQTPVWVIGAVESGDYIIASGNNDGFGIAVSEDELSLEQVPNIVGKSWETSDKVVNLVNVAVGLKTSDIVSILQKSEETVSDLTDRMAKIEGLLGVDGLAEN